MNRFNIIVVFSTDRKQVLMCRRRKAPYAGLLNFVGGHIESGETHEAAAYRELYEETSISNESIVLRHLMDFSYVDDDILLEVYYGKLSGSVEIGGEENELLWVDTSEDFSDIARFAGEGNIHHIMEYIKHYV